MDSIKKLERLRISCPSSLIFSFIQISLYMIASTTGTDLLGDLIWNIRVQDHYLEFQHKSLTQCAEECLIRNRCKAFSFSQKMKFCVLSLKAEHRKTIQTTGEETGFVTSNIASWSQVYTGKCANHKCSENEKCNTKDGRCEISELTIAVSYYDRYTDCGQAPSMPMFATSGAPSMPMFPTSGHHETGFGILYTCMENLTMVIDGEVKQENEEIIMCNDGKWENLTVNCVDMSPTTSSSNERSTTPSSNGSSTTLSSNGSSTTPSSNGTSSTPSSDGTSTTPSSNGASTIPSSNESSITPSSNESSTTPSSNGTCTTPSSDETSTTPSSNESSTIPSSNGSSTSPSSNESSTTPSSNGTGTTPSSNGTSTAPSSNESSATSSSNESSTTSSSNESSTCPSSNGTSTTPSSNESSTTPSSNGTSTTPSSNESSATPSSNESSTTSSSNESSTSPSSNESNTTSNGPSNGQGDWKTIQSRFDGSEDFNRNWDDYKNGFGKKSGEFWLGNEELYLITSTGLYQLRIELEDIYGNKRQADYRVFSVASEKYNYRLSVSGYHGNAGDSLTYHSGNDFSTKDKDNDRFGAKNCASTHKGGWWYNSCYLAHLNGLFPTASVPVPSSNMAWLSRSGTSMYLKSCKMMIRRHYV